MSRYPLGARLLAAALLWFACVSPGASQPPSRVPYLPERGDLVLEGVGPVDLGLAARLAPYTESREATFLDWLPDGSMLVSTRFADTAQIHRVAAPLGTREQLTYYDDPVTAAAAPRAAGAGFAFLKDRGGDENAQVYYYSLADRSARLLTSGAARHGGLVWSKDGKHLAFYGNERDGASYDIYVDDIGTAGSRPHLVVAGQQGIWVPLDWSADGKTLLVRQSLSIEDSHLYLADVTTGGITPVDSGSRKEGIRSARFAPDGRGIYLVSDETGEYSELRYIDLVTHQSRDLTAGIPWDITAFDVSADGRYIAYVVNEDGLSRLTVLDTRYKLELSPPGLPQGVISTLRFDRTGRWLALTAESPQSPRDVYVFDVELNRVVRWTESEPGPLAESAFVPAELVHFPTWDHAGAHRRMISAYVYRPRAPGPHAVLIDIHGGPEAQYRPTFDPFIQFLVNELGYAVVAPNVRGSSGYGRTFLGLDDGKLRGDAVRDIGSLLVWIDLQRDLDGTRIAIMGQGYGGYLALAALADYNDRLRGGIDFAGITDFATFLEETAPYRRGRLRAEYGDERTLGTREFLDHLSPIDRTRWIRKPLLVVQGLNDPGVPPTQSEQLVAMLRSRGDDVWYLAVKDEGRDFAKKSDRDTYYRVAATFLESLAE
jgi:dipeptidyl aminopeptidase/acylaminoacyl peptidase